MEDGALQGLNNPIWHEQRGCLDNARSASKKDRIRHSASLTEPQRYFKMK